MLKSGSSRKPYLVCSQKNADMRREGIDLEHSKPFSALSVFESDSLEHSSDTVTATSILFPAATSISSLLAM